MSGVSSSDQFDLHAINLKAHGAKQVTQAELDFAESLVFCSESEKAILANGILLLVGTEPQRRDSLNRIRVICQEGKQHQNQRGEIALLGIVEYFPAQELNNPIYKDFVYRMAKSPFVPCRINAMRVLRQFGRIGDRQAIVLLKEGTADSDKFVREGAERALSYQ